MLSGIKKGKRKRKSNVEDSSSKLKHSAVESTTKSGDGGGRVEHVSEIIQINRGRNDSKNNETSAKNYDAAQELRRMLAGVGGSKNVPSGIGTATPVATKKSDAMSPLERFEQRRGILSTSMGGNGGDNNSEGTPQEETVVLMMNSCSSATTKQPVLSKEDFRRGARKGKVKQKESYMRSNVDQTISEMVEEEKRSKQQGNKDRGMDEVFARNIARMGSRYKASDFKMVAGSTAGADEDDGTSIDMKMFTSVSDRLTDAEKYNREMSRQLALSKKQNTITNKCWWWIESDTFQKHRLISLGDHVRIDKRYCACTISHALVTFCIRRQFLPIYFSFSSLWLLG